MTQDELISIVRFHVPGLEPGEVTVLQDIGRILVAVRRPDRDLSELRRALSEIISPCVAWEVRAVADGVELLPQVSP